MIIDCFIKFEPDNVWHSICQLLCHIRSCTLTYYVCQLKGREFYDYVILNRGGDRDKRLKVILLNVTDFRHVISKLPILDLEQSDQRCSQKFLDGWNLFVRKAKFLRCSQIFFLKPTDGSAMRCQHNYFWINKNFFPAIFFHQSHQIIEWLLAR